MPFDARGTEGTSGTIQPPGGWNPNVRGRGTVGTRGVGGPPRDTAIVQLPNPIVQLGGGGGFSDPGFGGGPTPGTTPPPNFDNTADRNPDLDYALGALKDRLGNDVSGHAIDVAGGKLRDLGAGQSAEAAARRTQRGVSGTGVDSYDEGKIAGNTTRAIAGAATDITMGRERDKDAILAQIAGVGATQAGINQGDRRIALEQWRIQQDNQRAAEQAALARQMAILNMLAQQQNQTPPGMA